ncbi:receptor-type tyrosine-protein phosphatase delta-like [Alosa sapidissima]|uniref:receptor-type tyrosine-protein phosphatase delta-like n=1 Tax=Alosa sapidissima TaxID=34773 RepID=UPI001C08DD05|nr:receptor-type tyrosine-protein phosphatase delta-like [Alosa sapidissima]
MAYDVKDSSTVPGAPSLSVWQETASSALVRWQPPAPLNPGVELQGYRLQFGRKDVSPLATLEFTPRETEYAVTNVHRGATYLFRLSAKSRGGFGEEAVQELTVPEEVPRGYPQIADHANVTCCSVQLAWSPPVLAERNGAITEYTLAYQEADAAAGSSSLREFSLPAGQSSYTLNGLRPDTAYDVKIRAHTRVGPGPYSPRVQYRTTARGSDVPRNFTAKFVTKTTVLLTWKFSESRLPYRCMIEYNRQKMDVDARQVKTLVGGLQANTSYEFRMSCADSGEGAPTHRVIVRTAPPIQMKRPELDLEREPDNTLTIIIPPLDAKDLIKNVYVVVVPMKKNKSPPATPDDVDLDELLKEAGVQTRRSRQLQVTDSRRPYIAAIFLPGSLPPSFTLGNELMYRGYENRMLHPGQEYRVFLLAELNTTSGRMFVTSPFTEAVTVTEVNSQPVESGGDGLIWVVGPVLAVVFIICIVIAILLYKK